ncbi:hypothetical protein Ddye_021876 [Dipteronia dyeriana]|uniref:GH18 domain-containing protein n=1 Tax=Dipteronia dyeriana TaxID=168575 RepID=A0AAD9WXA3_9ROSI|nr:hypothetical protein Ddye_021876 [Dipteronia dyeriana]
MACLNNFSFFYMVVFITVTAAAAGSVMVSPRAVKAAYWPSWAENFPPSAINTSFFTHIYYAFLMPNDVTYKFNLENSTAILLSNFTTTIRHKNPPVKTLFSIGGGGSDSTIFTRLASEAGTRKVFIDSSLEVARKFGFDGVDLDWEFPESSKEMQDLGCLFDEWRLAIDNEANSTGQAPLLLTAAVYFSVDFFISEVYRKYPVDSITRNLDWISAMSFDYHGSWDTSLTGAHAALYDPKGNISTSYGLKSWLFAGVPSCKLVMGLPLYGRSWTLKDPNLHRIGSPGVGVGPGDKGFITLSEVDEFNRENAVTVTFDIETVSTYSFAGTTWIGYDDAFTTTTKIGFAQAHGLRGYFFWALSYEREWKITRQASRAWILND